MREEKGGSFRIERRGKREKREKSHLEKREGGV